ncbi:hypothetical protein [Streptomyces sp. NK08204]|uniref:hypothetical protein n=1 Tax=Streptomyces sp. NK08204 TaxID=2873260 RepID=UPI001CEDA243|nr:hypothetical protein [Streptomyces sp. NK08204]
MNSERPGDDDVTGTAEGAAPQDGDPGEGAGGRSRRRSSAAVVAVAAAVLLVGGGGAYVAADDGGNGRANHSAPGDGVTPPPLTLDGWVPGAPYGVTYVAGGALPQGPGSAPVYTPGGEVGRAAVARLAKALGVAGTPVAEGGVWRVGGGRDGFGPALQVNRDAPGSWTYSRYAPGTDNCRKVTVCTHDPASPAGGTVSVAAARKAAAPVLKALGQDDAKIDASRVMGARRVVDADPVVDGLPTYGWTTGLTVDGRGEVVGGHGLLEAPVKGDTYPVLGAKKTLELMNATPRGGHRMGIGGCARPVPLKNRLEQPCGASTGASGAPAASTVTVGKAVFGLAAHLVRGRQTLVPSWLFEVREPGTGAAGASTVTYPALDPTYLAPKTHGSRTHGPRTHGPKTHGPKTHGPKTREVKQDVKVDGYTADGRELTVSFSGGVCADYRVSAKESADRVTVKVTEASRPDTICVAMAEFYVRTVRLDAPLGGRQVAGVDGSQIPRTKPGALRPQAPGAAR